MPRILRAHAKSMRHRPVNSPNKSSEGSGQGYILKKYGCRILSAYGEAIFSWPLIEERFMKYVTSKMLATACLLLSMTAHAGFDEGMAAYNKKDFATALKKLTLLVSQGDARAQNNLGVMYVNGQGVPQDYDEAVKLFRLAAGQGHAGAQYNLGVRYGYGQGVPQNYTEAVKWYRLAADQGHAQAQFNLGVMYANGQGVSQDYKEAVKWIRLAADQGFAQAQFGLGLMYGNGQGVTQDYKNSVKWYRLAAAQGDAFAQSDLGFMYSKGQGVLQSRVIAFALYNVSAANDPSTGNKAAANRDGLSSLMTSAEIAAGQSLSLEMSKPGKLLKALDKYRKKPSKMS